MGSYMLAILLLLPSLHFSAAETQLGHERGLMNRGGIPYAISNPPGSTKGWIGEKGKYSIDFRRNVKGRVEHFDVYGEVRTQYSQVYWTRNTPVDLPPELVARFDGKFMAITGYEIDQVTHLGPELSSSSNDSNLGGFACYPSCKGTDKSIPIYNAYNHHYFGWLVGKDAEVYDLEEPLHMPNPTWTGVRSRPTAQETPTNIVFKENPGGEFRKSYHGYPSGFAQLIHSPTQWLVEPMQIDTHNRATGSLTEETGHQPWFLPQVQMTNVTDRGNGLSPLIECPCTDRISRHTVETPVIMVSGVCSEPISAADTCESAAREAANVTGVDIVSNASMPAGCILVPDVSTSGTYRAVWNTAASSHDCSFDRPGQPNSTGASMDLEGHADLGGLTDISIAYNGSSALINFSGPDGVWFGVGFNAGKMGDLPYAIIVDGQGQVTERKLADHGPGNLLNSSVTVVSQTVTSGVRSVLLRRPLAGISPDHYSLPTAPTTLGLITAVGSTPTLQYHKAKTAGRVVIIPSQAMSCLCQPQARNYLSYMNQSMAEFEGYNCVDEPRSDMLKHGDGTGRDVPNAACHMQSYNGGLQCCKHQYFLTDLGQSSLIPNETDRYFLKWRYYFQEYKPEEGQHPASHRHLHHWVFLIDADVNDYEEDNAHYGSSSIGKIEAHLTVKDMGLEEVPTDFKTAMPLVMTPHCHAPSCIREELWNADTGEILCNVTARYGSQQYGSMKKVFNEANYVALPPCIFGFQAGLQRPFVLPPSTNLTAVKYFNNTFRHLGQMAQWTGLLVYNQEPAFLV